MGKELDLLSGQPLQERACRGENGEQEASQEGLPAFTRETGM